MHEGDRPGRSPPIKWRDLLFWIISLNHPCSVPICTLDPKEKSNFSSHRIQRMSRTLWLINSFWSCSLNSIWTFPPTKPSDHKVYSQYCKDYPILSHPRGVCCAYFKHICIVVSNRYNHPDRYNSMVLFYLDSSPIESLISNLLYKYLHNSAQSTFNIFTDSFYDWYVCFVSVFVCVYMCLLWRNMSVKQLKGWEVYAGCYFHKSGPMLRWFHVPGPVVWLKHSEKHVTKAVHLAGVRRQRGKTAKRHSQTMAFKYAS